MPVQVSISEMRPPSATYLSSSHATGTQLVEAHEETLQEVFSYTKLTETGPASWFDPGIVS
jgi:hypothetical protein